MKSPPAKRAAVESKPPHNLKAKSIPADGNCLFESIAQCLSGKTARNVRASVVTHLTKHQGRYKPWWDGLEPTEAENVCESWETYLTMLSKVGAWGSALEVAAAAVHYDRPIVVFQPCGVPEIYNAHGKGGAPIALWYRSKHYERLEGAFPPEVLTQAANGPMQGNTVDQRVALRLVAQPDYQLCLRLFAAAKSVQRVLPPRPPLLRQSSAGIPLHLLLLLPVGARTRLEMLVNAKMRPVSRQNALSVQSGHAPCATILRGCAKDGLTRSEATSMRGIPMRRSS